MEQTLADRLKFLISDLDIYQKDMAKRIAISNPSLSNILSGKTNASPQTIWAICREYGVNREWLVEGKGEMYVTGQIQENIASFLGNILRDKDEFKLKLISALSYLDESDWNTLRKLSTYINKDSADDTESDS